MSTTRKAINKLISEKLNTRSQRLTEAGQDIDAVTTVLVDYRLYFSGVQDALQAAGLDADDTAIVGSAIAANEAEFVLAERRQELADLLAAE